MCMKVTFKSSLARNCKGNSRQGQKRKHLLFPRGSVFSCALLEAIPSHSKAQGKEKPLLQADCKERSEGFLESVQWNKSWRSGGHTCEGLPLLGSSASCPRPVPSSLWWKCVVPSFKTCPETPDLLRLFSSFLGFVHPCTAPHTESSGHLPAFSQPPAPFPTSLHCMSLPPRLEE